jgi:hypothetical protein
MVKGAIFPKYGLKHGEHLVFLAHVRLYKQSLPALVGDLLHDPACSFPVMSVVHHHSGTGRGQGFGDGLTDAGTGAGYQSCLSNKRRHSFSLEIERMDYSVATFPQNDKHEDTCKRTF